MGATAILDRFLIRRFLLLIIKHHTVVRKHPDIDYSFAVMNNVHDNSAAWRVADDTITRRPRDIIHELPYLRWKKVFTPGFAVSIAV